MSEEYDEFEDLSAELDDISDEPQEPNEKSISRTTKVSVYLQSTIGPSQRQERMTISTQAPVYDLKFTIGQIFNLPPEEFHLSHGGRTLDPDDIISNYDIEEGDTLLLIPISIAGKFNTL